MAKQKKHHEKYVTEEVLHNLDDTAKNAEQFFEKNANYFYIGFGVVILAVLGYFLYMKYYDEPKNIDGFNAMIKPEKLYQSDSLDAALGGEKSAVEGFTEIAENYKGTNAAKIAQYYAGSIEYKKGNYQKAIDNFEQFSSNNDILEALKYGAIGDCYVELKNMDDAISSYKKAIEKSDNSGTYYMFSKKAALALSSQNKNSEALEILQKVKDKFPDVDASGELDAYISMLTYQQ